MDKEAGLCLGGRDVSYRLEQAAKPQIQHPTKCSRLNPRP